MSSHNDNHQWLGFTAFVLACVLLAFLAGIFTAIFQAFPYPPIQKLVSEVASSLQNDSGKGSLHFLYKARNDDSGVTIYEPDAVQPGVTLVTGLWRDDGRWQPQVRLIDFEGAVLHSWEIHPEQLWPQSPHDDWAKGTHNKATNYVHGTALLPNGDIVFNVEYLSMIRMNACGDVMWKVPKRLHHSVDVDDEGNFWASGLIWREEAIADYVRLKPPFAEEYMVQVSPDGEVLREISALKALNDSGYQGTFLSNRVKYDLTHMNDVEVLSAELADDFPMFSAGDLLVSLRNYNMVIVVDGKTELVKWHFSHPLIHQHDPDFEPGGRIVIFDNNDDTTREGTLWGQTQILSVDPATKQFERIYPTRSDQPFYTQEGGKHQLLANGNRLITEANTGRVFEVSAAGETVWNWVIESRDGEYLPEVLEGTRYPASSLQFTEGA